MGNIIKFPEKEFKEDLDSKLVNDFILNFWHETGRDIISLKVTWTNNTWHANFETQLPSEEK